MRDSRQRVAASVALAAGLLVSSACAQDSPSPSPDSRVASASLVVGERVRTLYWSDGDSGRANGVKFRLAGIDAPETGGVGARGGAKCEMERELGYLAKEAIVEMTRPSEHVVTVTRVQPADRYGRVVVDMIVDGEDLGDLGVARGFLGAWPHRKGRAQAPKPDWCALAEVPGGRTGR